MSKTLTNIMVRGNTYYIRVPLSEATNDRKRCATWLKSTQLNGGKAAESLLRRIESVVSGVTPRWDLLAAFHDGRISLKMMDAALVRGGIKTLEMLVRETTRTKAENRSLVELCADWHGLKTGATNKPDVDTVKNRRAMVSACCIALGTIGNLTTPAIQAHVESRGRPITQRAHRAAISMFCDWLMKKGVLSENPCSEVVLEKVRPTNVRFQEFPDLMLIYNSMAPVPAKDAFGFMIATGVETSVPERVTHAQVDGPREMWALGTKGPARTRKVVVEAWFEPRMNELVARTPQGAPIFPVNRNKIALAVNATVKKLVAADPGLVRLKEFSPYHARHSWAVRWLRDRKAPIGLVSGQLGHCDNRMVNMLYGRWLPILSDFLLLDPSLLEPATVG